MQKKNLSLGKLEDDPSTRTIFRTLKRHVREGQPKSVSLHPELQNKNFTSMESTLSSEITKPDKKIQNTYFEKNFVLEAIPLDEVSKNIKSIKNNKPGSAKVGAISKSQQPRSF